MSKKGVCMPSGKTHEKINLLSLSITVYVVTALFSYLQFGWNGLFLSLDFFIAYLFGTYYLSPDLDLKSRPYFRWGWLRFIWIPYQKTFAHRSIWTHGIIIGDIIRIVYISLLIFIPYSLLIVALNFDNQQIFNSLHHILTKHASYFWMFGIGLCFASFLHIVADHIGSAVKKRKKQKNKRKTMKKGTQK